MGNSKSYIVFCTLFFLLFSCRNNTRKKTNVKYLNYTHAVLFSIDTSIYHSQDTVWHFPDGKPAYRFFLGGGSFIDSTGQPIHDRYSKYSLSNEENQNLKDSFLYELADNVGHSCFTMYRDVLVLYDSTGTVVQQAHICFACGDATIYPFREYMWQEESKLNFDDLKKFIDDIKH